MLAVLVVMVVQVDDTEDHEEFVHMRISSLVAS